MAYANHACNRPSFTKAQEAVRDFVSTDPKACAEDVKELGILGALHDWNESYGGLYSSEAEKKECLEWLQNRFPETEVQNG